PRAVSIAPQCSRKVNSSSEPQSLSVGYKRKSLQKSRAFFEFKVQCGERNAPLNTGLVGLVKWLSE
ncbi:hypothetical protein LEMLEM_LOCUS11681, partial [Lemmus lemmus]